MTTTEQDVAGSPAFTFAVPESFHEVPLDLDPEERLRRLADFAADYWGPGRTPERRIGAVLLDVQAQTLLEGGTVHQSMGFFAMDGEPARISRCTLLATVRDVPNPGPAVVAGGVVEALSRADDGSEVAPVMLPCGPAAVRIAASRAVWERPDDGGEALERFFVRVEVWIPFPDEDRVLLLSLSTPDVQDLQFHQGVLADIAHTVRFGALDVSEAGQPAEAGSRIRNAFG